jgi:hypothetical protein
VAFALFALLFILGLLFSTRAGTRVKPRMAPAPVDESSAEGGGAWGDDASSTSDHHDSGSASGTANEQRSPGKHEW